MSALTSIRNGKNLIWNGLLTGPLFWWLLLWVAWALRLWGLDVSDLTFDEAATHVVANRPLLDILTYLRGAVREHPPVFYLMMRPWMVLAGTSEYSMRFFAVGTSMIGIALTARLARTIARKFKIAATSELFFATSLPALVLALFPIEVYYARDARMYTLNIVWAALSSLLFLSFLIDDHLEFEPRLKQSIALVSVNALALFTHYYLLLLVVTQVISLLLLRRWRGLIAWCAAHGLAGLAGLLWLVRSPGLSASLTEAWGRFSLVWPTMDELRRLLADLLFGPIVGVPWSLVYSWGALMGLGLLTTWVEPSPASRRLRSKTVGAWLSITILLPVALAYLMPEPPRSRYLVFLLPFAALALGRIPMILTGRKSLGLVWVLLVVLVITNLGIFGAPRTITWTKSTYGHTIATIAAHARLGDGVVFYGPWQWAQYRYYQPSDFPPITALPPYAPPQLVPDEAEPVLRQLLNQYKRLWVIPAAVENVDPGFFLDNWLNSHAHPIWTTRDFELYLPQTQAQVQSPLKDLSIGDRLLLKRVTSDATAIPAGEGLRLTLTWAASQTLASDVQLDFSLLDAEHNRWLQWHRMPGSLGNPPSNWAKDDIITDRQGVIVPQGASPGTYVVQLTVVDMANGVPLQPSIGNEPLPQANVELLAFDVVEPITRPVLGDAGDFTGPFTFESPEGKNGAITLSSYELGGLKFQQGHYIPLRLHWLAPTEPTPDLELRLTVEHKAPTGSNASNAPWSVTTTLALAPGYPVTAWSPQRLVSLPTALLLPLDTPPGRAALRLAVLEPSGETWSIEGKSSLALARLTIDERPMLRQLPNDFNTVQVDFAQAVDSGVDQIGLRGYRIDGRAEPGGRLGLNYAWYALSQPTHVYSVFNHLLTADGQRIAQSDGWPQNGIVLTSQWRHGEYIQDSHTLEIPVDAPPGPYLLAIGLYDAATADRMHATHEEQPLPGDQWVLPLDSGN